MIENISSGVEFGMQRELSIVSLRYAITDAVIFYWRVSECEYLIKS